MIMKIKSNIHGIIVPHAPTLLVEEADDQSSFVIRELQDSGMRMQEWGVEVVVAVTTHWQTKDTFFIDNSSQHETIMDYDGFPRRIEYNVFGHPELANLLLQAGEENLIYPSIGKYGADHAIAIPLHFMFPERNIPIIPLSVSGSMLCAFRWGRTLGNTLRNWGGKVLFLVSSSFSHEGTRFMDDRMLIPEKFDQQVLKLLSEGKGMELLKIDQELMEKAKPEGAFRDLFMLLGVMGSRTQGNIRAYEKLSGVGMGIIEFTDFRPSIVLH
jgi:3,4-dihydroxyphenylacetate 2,3-dioxygenase